ncbi:MAG TPA: DMT family transporter [Jatrophihabitans sp.]|nr:DMT family transporter [Jatrophihabitans sp.]
MAGTRAVGTGLAVLSAATFSTSGSFATSLLDAGWTPGSAVILRIGIAALVLTAPAIQQLRGRWPTLRRHVSIVALYGVLAVGGAQLFFFEAVQHISVGVALLLEYSGILFVVAWMWARHGQRPRRLTVAGGALALGGLVLVLDLLGAQHVDFVGVLWGLGAATGLGVYFVVSARVDDSDEAIPPIAMVWAGMCLATVLLALTCALGVLPFRTSTADVTLAGAATSWVVPVAGMSLVAAVVAYTSGIGAARRLGARTASFLGLAEVLFAMLFAWLLLGQRPGVWQAIGGLVVLAGIALVRLDADEPTESALTSAAERAGGDELELRWAGAAARSDQVGDRCG